MTSDSSIPTSRDILIIGAGELGMPVIRNVVRRAKDVEGSPSACSCGPAPSRPRHPTSSATSLRSRTWA